MISAPRKDSTPNPDDAQIAIFSTPRRLLLLVISCPNIALLAINLTFPFFTQTMQNINVCFMALTDLGGALLEGAASCELLAFRARVIGQF